MDKLKTVIMLTLALALFALPAGCKKSEKPAPAAEEQVQLANPVVTVSKEELHARGLYLSLPATASEITYNLIDDVIGEVQFSYNSRIFSYRAAEGEQDISGVYEEFKDEALALNLDYEDYALEITVKNTLSGGALATFELSPVIYTLFTPDAMDADLMAELATRLSEDAYELKNAGTSETVSTVSGLTFIEQLELYIDAPKSATEVSYRINDESIACVRFTLDGRLYEFSAAHSPAVPAVVSDFERETETDVETDYYTGVMALRYTEGKNAVVMWEDATVSYCLYVYSNADTEELMHLSMQLASDTNTRYLRYTGSDTE